MRFPIPKLFTVEVLGRIRREIVFYLILFFGIWMILFFSFPYIFPYLMFPYFKLFKGNPLIFTSIEEALFVILRASFYLSLIITLPFLFMRLWKVISQEFFEPERIFFKKVFLIVFLLAICGLSIGYFIFIPLLLKVFLFFGKSFEAELKINYFLFFVLKVLLFSVLIFEIPVFLALLIKENIINEEFYKRKRIYFWGSFYVMSLCLAPTDFFIQLLLTLIFYLFFRLSFIIAKFLK